MNRMRGSFVLLTIVILLSLGGRLAADTVSGYVLDAETDARLPRVEVSFLLSAEAGLSEMVRRSTNAEGEFSFSGPFLKAGTAFTLVAHYGGLEYATDALQVGAQDEVIIEVFDGTDDDGQIGIEAHHLFLAVTTAGVDVAQLLHIDNLGTSTFVGHTKGDERHVLQLQVPAGNLALQGHGGQVSRSAPERLFTNAPLPPGRSQVSFTVQLMGEEFGGTYEHEILYPTNRLEMFLQPSDIELDGEFQDLGEIDLHDQTYRHYRLFDLNPGHTVSIELPLSRPVRWSLKWLVLGFVVAMMAAAVVLTRKGQGQIAAEADPVTTDAPAVVTEQQDLLGKLAEIDDELASADSGRSQHLQQQREELKQRVIELYRQPSRR